VHVNRGMGDLNKDSHIYGWDWPMIEAHQGTDHLPCKKSGVYLASSVQLSAEEESAMILLHSCAA
jgi:hypothetical protein